MAQCPVTITSIDVACGSNMAGIKEVYIGNFGLATFTYNYQQVLNPNYDPSDPDSPQYINVTDADGNDIKKSIATATLTGTETMQKFAFRKRTGSMTSTLTVNDNGTNYWETVCNLVFAKMDVDKRLSIMSLMQGETSIIVVDNNGNKWFLGLDNPCTMTEGTGETGVAYSDNNAYTITLGDSSPILPLIVEDAAFNVLYTV